MYLFYGNLTDVPYYKPSRLHCVVYYVLYYVHYASNRFKSVMFALNVQECNRAVLSFLLSNK